MCVLASPGTGKSEIAKTWLNNFPTSTIATAHFGTCAAILNGNTICTTFAIGSFQKECSDFLRDLSAVELDLEKG